jgi:Ca-activated chloride channel family protein
LVTFTEPFWLLSLLAVPLLVWWWLRQGRAALRYSAASLLMCLPRGRGKYVRRTGAGLRAAALVFLIIGLAGPRWPDPGTRIPTEGVAIAMVVDTSGSMANQDYVWDKQPISRLDAVKKAFRLLVEGGLEPGGRQLLGRPQDLISLITYATRPETSCPLTLNHAVLLQILDAQMPRTISTEATTNTGDAIAWALHSLRSSRAKRKVIILLTDGEHNVPPPALKPRQAAQLAGNLAVPIYTIQAGNETTPDGTPSEEAIKSRQTLVEIAKMTQGQYFQAADTEGLLEVCNKIDRLERQEIESFQYRRYYEAFVWFGLASLLLWMLVFVLEGTVWRTIP